MENGQKQRLGILILFSPIPVFPSLTACLLMLGLQLFYQIPMLCACVMLYLWYYKISVEIQEWVKTIYSWSCLCPFSIPISANILE